MNNVNYDPEFFDEDEYGNLIPKQDGFIDDDCVEEDFVGYFDEDDEPSKECFDCPNFKFCWPNYQENDNEV